MHSDRTRELHPARSSADRPASAFARDPWNVDRGELSTSELLAFLEDFPGQLATVTAITPPPPRRFNRGIQAIRRGFEYFVGSLENLTDVYDL